MRKVGTVKNYRSRNGCGFIKDAGGGPDVFVHVSNIMDNDGDPADILLPGEVVEYEVFQSSKGPAALRIERKNPLVLQRVSGVVKKVFEHKGYGFIESRGNDVFFNYADVLFDDIVRGLSVTYLQAEIQGKQRAFRVRKTYG